MDTLMVLAGLRASHYVLVAVGFALVLGSCRVLNVMHGSYVMLGAYATYACCFLLRHVGLAVQSIMPLAVLLAAISTAVFGFVFFRLLQITRRTALSHVLAISMAGNLFVARLVAYVWGAEGLNVPPILRGTVSVASVSVPVGDLLIPLAAALSVIGLWIWLHRTRSGMALRAVADDPVAARLMGIKPDRTLAVAVAVAAFLAGLAGALRAPGQTLSPSMWVHPLIVSFAVVVLGGRNSLGGAVLGAGLLGVVETATSWYWNEAASRFIALLAIILGLFCFPTGLVGSSRYERR